MMTERSFFIPRLRLYQASALEKPELMFAGALDDTPLLVY
jgi:hypothetical protein